MVVLPNKWVPRWYQRPLWDYLETGGRFAIEIAHRRWGKDEVVLHRTACASHERVGNYWHCLPEYEQARKAIWTAVNPHTGIRRIDEAFPEELRAGKDEQQMFIRFKNGSTWQVIGSDRYNSLVGAGVIGVTFSEWALANPSAWGYIRPMIEENNGWAAFITTPRGANHAKAMYEMAQKSKGWFAEVSNITKTGALSPDQVEQALAEYQALYGDDFGKAQFEQEYLCSWNAAILGSFYAGEMARVRAEGRIREVVPIHWCPRRHFDLLVPDVQGQGRQRPPLHPRLLYKPRRWRRSLRRRGLFEAVADGRLCRLRTARRQGDGVRHRPHPHRNHEAAGAQALPGTRCFEA